MNTDFRLELKARGREVLAAEGITADSVPLALFAAEVDGVAKHATDAGDAISPGAIADEVVGSLSAEVASSLVGVSAQLRARREGDQTRDLMVIWDLAFSIASKRVAEQAAA